MTCSACLGSAPDGSRFCPSCGRALIDTKDLSGGHAVTRMTAALDETKAAATGVIGGASYAHAIATGAAFVSDAPFAPGTLLASRYRIVRMLGRGGMGVVYQADDLRLGHAVALKFLPPALAGDPRRLAQFHNEVSLARQISHPNVCRVYDIGDVDGHLLLSMEYIDGEDLAAAIRRKGRFPESEAVELTRQICAGLAAVHAQGVLHRDLKPANIMINAAGQAQLMDFGIAAAGAIDDLERITEGTPAYMAPEQLARQDVSVRSDIYALGLVMYEIFTGRRPFDGKTLDELIQERTSVADTIAKDLPGVVQPRVEQAILQCLDRDPCRRPPSVLAVAAMLQIVLLDAHTKGRRILQVATQMLTIPFIGLGSASLLRAGGDAIAGLVMIGAAALAIVIELRSPLGWTVEYKGHRIRFYNNPIFGERLYIDDVLVDRGRFGFNITLRGTIERGLGAGERITAIATCSLVSMSCRIVAESFSPGAHA